MELAVEKRDIKGKVADVRKRGLLPAVIYGRSQEATPIAIDEKAFEKIFRAAGESTVITLTGLGAAKEALIHEVSVHPVSGSLLHADFYAIQKGQTVTVSIPFEFEGISEAVKSKGGILVKVMHELEIECEPKDLPQHIVVDISTLENIDDKVTIGELKLPLSAKISADKDEVVAMITEAKEEVEETGAVDLSQIETSVERGKKEEEPEEAE
jgi:large subunit ribosomal protein L25